MMNPQANAIYFIRASVKADSYILSHRLVHFGDVLYLFFVSGRLYNKREISFLCPQLEFPIIIPITSRSWHSRAFNTLSPYCLSHSL